MSERISDCPQCGGERYSHMDHLCLNQGLTSALAIDATKFRPAPSGEEGDYMAPENFIDDSRALKGEAKADATAPDASREEEAK